MFSTALVRAHEAGDACTQNGKNGDSAEPKEPPRSATGSCKHCLHESFGSQYSAEYSLMCLVKVTFQVAMHNQSFVPNIHCIHEWVESFHPLYKINSFHTL